LPGRLTGSGAKEEGEVMKLRLTVGALFITFISCAQARPSFTVEVLAGLPETQAGSANAINDAGQAVGSLDGPGLLQSHAVLWDENGQVIDLAPSSFSSSAYAISSSGEIVGSVNTARNNLLPQPVVFETTGPRLLSNLPGHPYGKAYGVDVHGDVVGISLGADTQAVVWLGGRGPARSLGGKGTFAQAINDSGTVVVGNISSTPSPLPVAWLGFKEMINLELLPGGTAGLASAVNNEGEIIGLADAATPPYSRAVKWSPNATMTAWTIADLGAIGTDDSEARAISSAGFVAGFFDKPSADLIPVLFDPIGRVEQLPLLANSHTTVVSGVNRALNIVGWTFVGPANTSVPLIWTPPPLPPLPCPMGGTTCQ
jgi:probable HAF family extracellular repeat protein